MTLQKSQRANALGITQRFKDLKEGIRALPQRIALLGQADSGTASPTAPTPITSAAEAGRLFGYGSPVHLAALQLFPPTGAGSVGTLPVTVYPLAEAQSATVAESSITVSGTATSAGTFRVTFAGIESEIVSVAVGDTAEAIIARLVLAINSVVSMPVTATNETTTVDVTSKWKGASANGITTNIEKVGGEGLTITVNDPTSGTVDPDLAPALEQFGDNWETVVVSCLGATSDALDALSEANETRYGALVHAPFLAVSGSNLETVAEAQAITQSRVLDRTNLLITAPDCGNMPLQIAAAAAGQIALTAEADPANGYAMKQLRGLIPGRNAKQWNNSQRNQAVLSGAGTTTLKNGVIVLMDTITPYRPEGEPEPAYRYAVDIMKNMLIVYNLELIFEAEEWSSPPMAPDGRPINNPNAKTPSMAVAQVWGLLDALGLAAVIADSDAAKDTVVADIDADNPKRLNISFTAALSGNAIVKDVLFNFGFYFGGQ